MRFWQAYFKYIAVLIKSKSLIGRGPLWRRDSLPWLERVEAAYPEIRDEIVNYLAAGHRMPDKEDLDPGRTAQYGTDRWEILHLLVYGERMPGIAEHFPGTLRIAQAIPGMCSIMFSRLPPERKHIPRHRDSENGTLRMHLSLIVPAKGQCFICVGGQTMHWKEGEAFVMDATFEHEVTKESESERIVLIVDFYRPVPRWVAWFTHRLYARHGGRLAKNVLRESYNRIARQP